MRGIGGETLNVRYLRFDQFVKMPSTYDISKLASVVKQLAKSP